ncbi:MAG: LAGLIDADG family homing endonuclease [Nanoarchaeota archaeon]|nr:LAGLIDADG family homing endonuclease [Nanoarchaeota archaeon]
MRIKKLKIGFEKLTKAKARIIAHLIGDGCAFKSNTDYNLKYDISDRELLNSFKNDIWRVYGLKLTIGLKPSGKTGKLLPFVRLRSKLAYEDLLSYSSYYSKDWILKNKFLNSSREIKREFLRALFDDEGSVVPQSKSAVIRLYSINLKGLKQIEKILNDFDVHSNLQGGYGARRNVYALIIKDLELFDGRIGFNLRRKQERLNQFLK